jgi:hypothetical protein
MHGMTPEQVQDIVEKFQDEEDKGILWEDAFEPETFKTQEERIFWDYILECEMLEGR